MGEEGGKIMWKCPICNISNQDNLICSKCGWDETKNYEQYFSVYRLPVKTQKQYKEMLQKCRENTENYQKLNSSIDSSNQKKQERERTSSNTSQSYGKIRVGGFLVCRYELLEKLASGNWLDVYKAKDHSCNRIVVIKVFQESVIENQSLSKRIEFNIRTAINLVHKNIAAIYDVEWENKILFFVEEWIEGITLKHYLKWKGKLAPKEANCIAIQIAEALGAAHRQNIIHGNLTPDYIMISTEGQVKVLDFGFTQTINSCKGIADISVSSTFYESPEYCRGGYCDARSNIYALGAILYKMITGEPPFVGETALVVALAHISNEVVPHSQKIAEEMPEALETIILKCLKKNPSERYADGNELAEALKAAILTQNNFLSDTHLADVTTLIQEETVISRSDIQMVKRDFPHHSQLYMEIPEWQEQKKELEKKLKQLSGFFQKNERNRVEKQIALINSKLSRKYYMIAWNYQWGDNTSKQDKQKSKKWLQAAADLGDEQAKMDLEELEEQ